MRVAKREVSREVVPDIELERFVNLSNSDPLKEPLPIASPAGNPAGRLAEGVERQNESKPLN